MFLAINRLITDLWGEHSTSPLNFVFFGYPCGALLSIAFVQMFRSSAYALIGPYSIASFFAFICSMGLMFIAWEERKRRNADRSDDPREKPSLAKAHSIWIRLSPTTCGNGHMIYGFALLICLMLFQMFFGLFSAERSWHDSALPSVSGAIEQGFTKFFISFLENEKILNAKDSVNSMIFYWFPLFVGRILSTYLTVNRLRPGSLLFICLAFTLIVYIVWISLLWTHEMKLWLIYLLVTGNGLSISSISPTFIGWTKLFLELTPFELTLVLLSNAAGGIVISPSVRFILQQFPSKHLFTLLISCALLCLIFYLFAYLLEYFHLKRAPSLPQRGVDPTEEKFLPPPT